MNKEQFKASWEQLEGHLKTRWGKFTDEDLSPIKGDQDKFNIANAKRYGEMKGDVSKWADLWYARWTGSYEAYYAQWKPAVGSRF